MPHRTLDLQETAGYLHLAPAELERLVKNQEIPHERRGDRLLFRKVELDAWASPLILRLEGKRLAEYHGKTSEAVRRVLAHEVLAAELLKPQWIHPTVAARTKASVLREMAALAERTGHVYDPKQLLAGLQAREELCSTGLPGGWALLHARNPEPYVVESAFLVLGRTVQHIPFGAPDGRATDLFFLLACPDPRLHLHTLARLCLIAQKTDLLNTLRAASSPEEMHRSLLAAETEVLQKAKTGAPHFLPV